MNDLASAMLYLPTVLFWLLVLFLLISELVGRFAVTARWRFRRYAMVVLLMGATWYIAEGAHKLYLTPPDWQPWSHFSMITLPTVSIQQDSTAPIPPAADKPQ